MNHYGEKDFKVEISKDIFKIMFLNHETGAEMTLLGPIKGVYESKERELDRINAEKLGREIAHVLRRVLSEK